MMTDIGIAVFFLRYWQESKDRLFAFFSLAFMVMAISQLVIFVFREAGEFGPIAYFVRLAAFILIILGIVAKNMPHKAAKDE